jgi:hypothetical protein
MSTETVSKKNKGKSILLYTLGGLIALIAVVCVAASMQPGPFSYSRSATFKATPAAVFEQVNDFHKWDAWSPWAKLDPNAKTTFEGPANGEGAKFTWDGDSNVGAGNMTIVESKPNDVVRIRLEFIRPMAGVNDVEMKIVPKGDETSLTWTMSGENSFPAKVVGLFMDCEKMCGDMFNKGLANIKNIVEHPPVRSNEAPAATPSET